MIAISRRRMLRASASAAGLAGLGAGAAVLVATPGYGQSRTVRTPAQTAGPFYPTEFPLETDNDLTRITGRPGVAAGEITQLSGNVFDVRGRPIKDVQLEIWQCNAHGRYHHPRDTGNAPLDPNFQAYGRTVADEAGGYFFRTIKPVPYPGRTPHIHFRVTGPDIRPLVTQLYVAGHPMNAQDGLYRSARSGAEQDALLAIFKPQPNGKEWSAKWDIVLERIG